jgi:hypothetical protein
MIALSSVAMRVALLNIEFINDNRKKHSVSKINNNNNNNNNVNNNYYYYPKLTAHE